jgi:SNF2 family DNA or RNA helicase
MPGATGKKEGKTRLLNIVMQLRKCCNHPYRELASSSVRCDELTGSVRWRCELLSTDCRQSLRVGAGTAIHYG